MFITNSNLPQSLEFCDKIHNQDRERCYGGAFMENSTGSTDDHPSAWIDVNDDYYPCKILRAHYQYQCYYYQSNYLLKKTTYDYVKTFDFCLSLIGINRNSCLLGIGGSLAGLSTQIGIEKVAPICDIPNNNHGKNSCIEGAVPSLVARYGGVNSIIVRFCQSTSNNLKELCFVKLNYLARSWAYGENKIRDICSQAGNYQSACLGESKIKPLFN